MDPFDTFQFGSLDAYENLDAAWPLKEEEFDFGGLSPGFDFQAPLPYLQQQPLPPQQPLPQEGSLLQQPFYPILSDSGGQAFSYFSAPQSFPLSYMFPVDNMPMAPPLPPPPPVDLTPNTAAKLKRRASEMQYDPDEEALHMMKAMRHGSVGRIMSESKYAASRFYAAPPLILQKTMEERRQFRKDIVIKFMRYLNMSDMGSLSQLIRENGHDRVMFVSPDIRDPIFGKADLMILFSLYMETFPDGVWKVMATEIEEDKIVCRFRFRGTKVFPYPIETVLKQVKAHMDKEALVTSTSSAAETSIQLVQDVSERVHPTVAERFNSSAMASVSVAKALKQLQLQPPEAGAANIASGLPNEVYSEIMLGASKAVENAVLQHGGVAYHRKADFHFDENDKLVRVIATGL